MKNENRRAAGFLALASLVAALAGCAGAGKINVSAISTSVRAVADRHDDYVRSDADLTDLERRVYLRSSSLLLRVVEEAEGHADAVE